MSAKIVNRGARVCALVFFTVLSAATLAAPSALALPEGRVYEMVSPVYKAGYAAFEITAVAPDGESVAFNSQGGFAGLLSTSSIDANEYVARRGSSGWSTASLQPPFGGFEDVSANLEYALSQGKIGPNVGSAGYEGTEQEYLLHGTTAPETVADWDVFGGRVLEQVNGLPGNGSQEEGASADLCHVVVGLTGPLLAEAVDTQGQIYDFSRGCEGGEPSLRLVGLNNRSPVATPINRDCQVELGIGKDGYLVSEQESNLHAVSADGSEIFFTTSVVQGIECPNGVHQLFVRLSGSRTLEVSRPLEASKPFGGCVTGGVPGEVPCAGAAERASAYFKGASVDGSRVFFTTTAPLTGGSEAQGRNLYMATIGCPAAEPSCEAGGREVTSLAKVSAGSRPGEAAEVQGVLSVASDGSHVYFVAHGVLGEGANAEGHAPVSGADNLYVYEGASGGVPGKVVFVADLCSGPELSGTVEDVRCPSTLESSSFTQARNDTGLWGPGPEAQTNSCPQASAGCEAGRFLVFSTYAELLKNDTDTGRDVYRYDAVAGTLERVSVGEGGADANGNDNAFDASIAAGHMGYGAYNYLEYEMSSRAISENGSRIVFSTAAPLSPDATNHLANVYEWHKEPGWSEGRVSIVSSGSSDQPSTGAVISPSGRDLFFITSQGLVPQDTDGQGDIYDARLAGGFAPLPAERERCEGDACQGALTNPSPLLVPGSVSQAPGENLAPVSEPVVKTEKTKVKRTKKTKAKRKVRRKGRQGKALGRPGRASRAAGRSAR